MKKLLYRYININIEARKMSKKKSTGKIDGVQYKFASVQPKKRKGGKRKSKKSELVNLL